MGNIGPEKLVLLLVVALIVLGPSKLPEVARTAGKVLAEFRKVSGGFQAELRDAFFDPVSSTRDMISGGSATPNGSYSPYSAGGGLPSGSGPSGSDPGHGGSAGRSQGGRSQGGRGPGAVPLPDDPTLN